MIAGLVNADREAIVPLRVRGADGHEDEVEAVVDTGFDGFLTLPPGAIRSLGLTRLGRGRATLANGSEDVFDIYEATVVWDGRLRSVEVDAVDTPALMGMSLLERYELHIQVVTGGQVRIEPLP